MQLDITDGLCNDIDSFREYAIWNWAHHCLKATDSNVTPELDATVKKFVSEKEAMAFDQWLADVKKLTESNRAPSSYLKELDAILSHDGSPIFMAPVYGIPVILEEVESSAPRTGRAAEYNAKNAHGAGEPKPFCFSCATELKSMRLVDFWQPTAGICVSWPSGSCAILIKEREDLFAPGKFTCALDAAMAGGNEQVIKPLLKASDISDTVGLGKAL